MKSIMIGTVVGIAVGSFWLAGVVRAEEGGELEKPKELLSSIQNTTARGHFASALERHDAALQRRDAALQRRAAALQHANDRPGFGRGLGSGLTRESKIGSKSRVRGLSGRLLKE